MATILSALTAEDLGQDATDEDLEQFLGWATTLMTRDHLSEREAISTLWGSGDYIAAAERLGLRPDFGPLE
jgi:hypothetical protein